VLEKDQVVVQNNKEIFQHPFQADEVMFFCGLPEMGKNLVWKFMDTDPSLFLNFYQKVKNFMRALQVVTRYVPPHTPTQPTCSTGPTTTRKHQKTETTWYNKHDYNNRIFE
jgi:hypothetical protein